MKDIIKTIRQNKGVEGNNEVETQKHRPGASYNHYHEWLRDIAFTGGYD